MQLLAWSIAVWLFALGAYADESQARELFAAGVDAMLAHNWPEAARLLEASLVHKDKPACRYNLVVAQRELERPLEVARHAVAFLATVEGRSHSEEAAEVRTFLGEAVSELVTLQAEGLPLGAQLKIDGAPPRVMDGSRIYVSPGLHRLELWVGERQLESIEIELGPGAVQPWPRVRALDERAAPAPAAPGDAKSDTLAVASGVALAGTTNKSSIDAQLRPTNRRLALGLGLTGAATGLAAVASYGYLARRARELRDWDTAEPGYTTAADRYQRIQLSVTPLALAGGALMASATPFAMHQPRAARAVSISALIAGIVAMVVGATLLIRTPSILVDGTDITEPSREAGSLCLGAALPLLAYSVRLQWDLRHPPGRR